MIESAYWKTELLVAADDIENKSSINRWTEKRAVLLEREIMLAMFCVRSLIERSKLSQSLVQKEIEVVAYPKKGDKPVTFLNRGAIDELYDLTATSTKQVTVSFLCNQIIHSYIIFPLRDGNRQFTHVMVCSDYEKNRFLYTVPIATIVKLIREVASDYPSRMHLEFDPKIKDYRVSNVESMSSDVSRS
jgi:hypothetical protein